MIQIKSRSAASIAAASTSGVPNFNRCPPPPTKRVVVKDDKIELLEKVYFVQSKATLLKKSFDVLDESDFKSGVRWFACFWV